MKRDSLNRGSFSVTVNITSYKLVDIQLRFGGHTASIFKVEDCICIVRLDGKEQLE